MWLFRRRWDDLSLAQQEQLTALFDRIPVVGEIYHRREELSAIFDSTADRAEAKRRIDEWCAQATASESDWSDIVNCLRRYEAGILAYFDERQSSGVVEGLNNKARVIQKRCYGLKTIASFWTRLLLETGNLVDRCLRSVDRLRDIAHAIKARFCLDYT